MNEQRKEAINKITSLAQKYDIPADEISNALIQKNGQNSYSKLLLYIGVILVATTIVALLSQFWTKIDDFIRVLSVMVTGIISYLLMIKLYHSKYNITTPFAIFSAISIILGIFLTLSTIFPKTPDARPTILIVFLLMVLQQLFTFLYMRITTPLFFIILFASITYLVEASILNLDSRLVFFLLGISYIFLSLYFYDTIHATIVFLGFFWGSIAMNLSVYSFMYKTPLEPIITILLAAQLYLGTKIQSKPLIFVNILGLMLYLMDLTTRLFHKSIPWLISISSIGLLLITYVILNIRKESSRTQR